MRSWFVTNICCSWNILFMNYSWNKTNIRAPKLQNLFRLWDLLQKSWNQRMFYHMQRKWSRVHILLFVALSNTLTKKPIFCPPPLLSHLPSSYTVMSHLLTWIMCRQERNLAENQWLHLPPSLLLWTNKPPEAWQRDWDERKEKDREIYENRRKNPFFHWPFLCSSLRSPRILFPLRVRDQTSITVLLMSSGYWLCLDSGKEIRGERQRKGDLCPSEQPISLNWTQNSCIPPVCVCVNPSEPDI